MSKLSKIIGETNPIKIVNILRNATDEIELFDPGGGHGQGWKIIKTGATGSIPLNTHGAKNLKSAIQELTKAIEEAGLS